MEAKKKNASDRISIPITLSMRTLIEDTADFHERSKSSVCRESIKEGMAKLKAEDLDSEGSGPFTMFSMYISQELHEEVEHMAKQFNKSKALVCRKAIAAAMDQPEGH